MDIYKMKYILYIILLIAFILIILCEYELFGNIHKKFNPQYYKDPYFVVNHVSQTDSKRGYNIAKSKRIVFCGLCRNLEHIISKNIKLLETTGEYFKDYRIVLFENDSSDNTRNLISEYEKENAKLILLECGEENPNCKFNDKKMYDYGSLSKKRIERMTYFRNQYLNYVKDNFSDYDYVMMMDMDLEGYFNMDGFMEILAKENWDAVFTNGRMGMVGTLGLFDCMYDGMAYVDNSLEYENFINRTFTSPEMTKNFFKMQLLNQKWINVKSAFNGCGIYKMYAIQNSSFLPNYTCEWIGFHHQIAKNGYTNFLISRDWKFYSGKQGDSFFKFFIS